MISQVVVSRQQRTLLTWVLVYLFNTYSLNCGTVQYCRSLSDHQILVPLSSLCDQSDKRPALTGWRIIPYGCQQIPLIFSCHPLLTAHKHKQTWIHVDTQPHIHTWLEANKCSDKESGSHNTANKSSLKSSVATHLHRNNHRYSTGSKEYRKHLKQSPL